MENALSQVFTHEKFGEIRIVIIDGKIWFVAADVCRVLGIKNPTQALKRLKANERKLVDLNTLTNNEGITGATFGWIKNEVIIVNEPGLYRLIFASRKPEAEKFQDWIYTEVIPKAVREKAAKKKSTRRKKIEPTKKIVLPPNFKELDDREKVSKFYSQIDGADIEHYWVREVDENGNPCDVLHIGFRNRGKYKVVSSDDEE